MRLYLVRHPRPELAPGICYGASEVPCSDASFAQAATLLRPSLPYGLPVFTSPLQRCERFAQVLCGLAPSMSYQVEERLREMDFGAWEGRAWADIAQTELSAWADDFAHYRCGHSGESTAQVVTRVAAALMEQARMQQDAVWITHAGVIRALQWLAGPARDDRLSCAARRLDLPLRLAQLRAADWPRSEVPWAQALIWDWPHHAGTSSGRL